MYTKGIAGFGGPGRDRTDDLFHAMEARSQLRHRPTIFGGYEFNSPAAVIVSQTPVLVRPIVHTESLWLNSRHFRFGGCHEDGFALPNIGPVRNHGSHHEGGTTCRVTRMLVINRGIEYRSIPDKADGDYVWLLLWIDCREASHPHSLQPSANFWRDEQRFVKHEQIPMSKSPPILDFPKISAKKPQPLLADLPFRLLPLLRHA